MTLRVSRELLGVLLVSSALIGTLAACGGDDLQPPTGDAGDEDAAPRDAGPDDATVDAGDVDAGACVDDDGDGHAAASCGGDDCDDADASRSPSAPEVCDGVDNDCSGSTDDGVCVPCAAGYTGVDGDCTDVNECALGTDDCDRDPAAICTNTPGSFTCACPTGFAGSAASGHGVGGCLLSDPSLSSLVPSASALSPAFAGDTTMYTLGLPAGTTSLTFTPAITYPLHATITVDGVTVASGAASAPISLLGFAPRPVAMTVTTETGATRTYTVVVGRSPAYVKASNTGANDTFGSGLSLSADGTRLAVGAYLEASSATGVDGNQADNSALDSGAVYVFSRADTTWTQEAYVKASNTGAIDHFGTYVALSADGTRLAVGAPSESSSATGVGGDQADDGAGSSGAVYVFSRTGTAWTQEAYLKASNTGVGDFFGPVSLSSDGTRLAVGAWGEDSSATGVGGNEADNSVADSGAVYVFSRTGTTWTQEAYIKASNTEWSDRFGYSVSLSSDGTLLAVGARDEDSSATGVGGNQADNTAAFSGAAYVFSRTGTTWAQEAYVKASNTEASDNFGFSVSLSADGTRLAVGALREDSSATGVGGNQADNSARDSGAVYVFSRTGTTWAQEAYVKASNTEANDNFGWPVSLSSDGARLAVGAPGESSSATGVDGDQTDNGELRSGAAYVFSRTGTTWTQEAYLKASNTGANDGFGISVSLSSDGTRLAVGASGEDSNATGVGGNQANNSARNSGAVYAY